MPITVSEKPESDLTVFTVEGTPSFEEFMSELRSFYDGSPTRNVLWNLDRASVWELTVAQIERLALYAPRIKKSSPDAKTAFVVSDDLTESMTALFIQYGLSKGLKRQTAVFPTQEDALAWLTDGDISEKTETVRTKGKSPRPGPL